MWSDCLSNFCHPDNKAHFSCNKLHKKVSLYFHFLSLLLFLSSDLSLGSRATRAERNTGIIFYVTQMIFYPVSWMVLPFRCLICAKPLWTLHICHVLVHNWMISCYICDRRMAKARVTIWLIVHCERRYALLIWHLCRAWKCIVLYFSVNWINHVFAPSSASLSRYKLYSQFGIFLMLHTFLSSYYLLLYVVFSL